jgi:hypothetical protein
MSLPTENRHLALASTGGAGQQTSERRRLGLSVVDKLAVTAFATGDHEALLEQVRARADVLVGPDADACRRRIIAKRLATTEGHVELLEALVGQALAQRDFDAVEILDRLLRSYSSRLVFLRREHADEMQRGRSSAPRRAASTFSTSMRPTDSIGQQTPGGKRRFSSR